MTLEELKPLLQLLRENGVTEYSSADAAGGRVHLVLSAEFTIGPPKWLQAAPAAKAEEDLEGKKKPPEEDPDLFAHVGG